MKQPFAQTFPLEQRLPVPFQDLEPYLLWALESEGDRQARRLASTIEELRAFYDATTPRVESIAEYLNQFALDQMPGDARRLLYLAFSWTEIASAVEIYRQPRVINGLDHSSLIVTGAGSGIGRATAIRLASEGAMVVAADMNGANCEATWSALKESGAQAAWQRVDVSKAQEIETLVAFAAKTFGRLDCPVNNAGIQGEVASTVDCSEENWDRIIGTNLKGVFLCLKYELRAMLHQSHGSIVNTASNFGLVGSAQMPAYSASKHGVVGLTKTAALEVAQHGIRVNAVCPGPTLTPLSEAVLKDDPSFPVISRIPAGRWGKAEEIAEAIAWLCSDAACFVVGAVLPVDGGFVAQ